MKHRVFRCEALDRPLSRDPHLIEGWALGEYTALVVEGFYSRRKTMDDKFMGMVRHVMTAVGAVAVFYGWTDDASWAMVSGGLATLLSFVWSWMSKPEVA